MGGFYFTYNFKALLSVVAKTVAVLFFHSTDVPYI